MRVNIQVSVYPLATEKVGEKVMAAIQVAKSAGVEMFTTPMSTQFSSGLEEGLETLGKMYEAVAKDGQAIMTVTISNCCGT